MGDTFARTGTAFAVVSPCSQCKNQLSQNSPEGKPFCPRRKWQEDLAKIKKANNGNSDPLIEPLAAFGTEGTSQEEDQSLRNPVYSDDGKSTLIWIATLRDNSGLRDNDNNVVAPSILDPTFIPDFTEFINCRPLPYIYAQHEASYRTTGALKEGDTVLAITAQDQQNLPITLVDGDNPNEYRQILIEGTINKIDLVYRTPRASIEVDHNVQGT